MTIKKFMCLQLSHRLPELLLKQNFSTTLAFSKNFEKNKSKKNSGLTEKEYQQLVNPSEIYESNCKNVFQNLVSTTFYIGN